MMTMLRSPTPAEQDLVHLRSEISSLKTSLATLQRSPCASSELVKLNVGGRIFTTRKSTLAAVPGSFFEAIISGRHSVSFDEQGCIFIDRCPTHMELILNWLRDPFAPRCLPENKAELFHELDFYGLKDALLHRKPVMFVIGGWRNYQPDDQCYVNVLASVECYDITSGVWHTGVSLPSPRGNACAVVFDGHVCMIGGQTDDDEFACNVVNIFDPDLSTWDSLPRMQSKRSDAGAACVGGELYVLGGADEKDKEVNTVERYDVQRKEWVSIAPLITKRAAFGYASLGGFIYAVGGFEGDDVRLDLAERFDPKLGRWLAVRPMSARRSGLGCASLGSCLYAVGGWNQEDGYLSSAERYDPATDTWTAIASMPTPRTGLQCVAAEGFLFAIGGHNREGCLNVVERYDPETDAWRAIPPMAETRTVPACVVVNMLRL